MVISRFQIIYNHNSTNLTSVQNKYLVVAFHTINKDSLLKNEFFSKS